MSILGQKLQNKVVSKVLTGSNELTSTAKSYVNVQQKYRFTKLLQFCQGAAEIKAHVYYLDERIDGWDAKSNQKLIQRNTDLNFLENNDILAGF